MSKQQRNLSGNPAKRAAQAARLRASSGSHASSQSGQHSTDSRPVWRLWLAGARLRTLPLAVAPVLLGAALAHRVHSFSLTLSLLALIVALALQIGVNYANDYSDGIRGTDDFRAGPARLTGSKAVQPHLVKNAAFACFGMAGLAGIAAVAISGMWWFLAIGAVAVLAAWGYTGGKRPYGYMALGEVAVFVFFGLVATAGTYFLQARVNLPELWWAASGVGLFAVAALIANNIRDIPTDRLAGKRTLAVLLGSRASRALYVVCVAAPFAVPVLFAPFYGGMPLVYLVGFIAAPAAIIAICARTPRELILVLQLTSYAGFLYAATLSAAFAL
ncbi:MAG: 1,4-dihydroxy-2-naphthoate polyprenyltransferase [Microbacteriaceae bacterium]|nr:1,4-dihydroxy-2-naphthoate polyprenyltransferase [Microbacteriaceae bacterium]